MHARKSQQNHTERAPGLAGGRRLLIAAVGSALLVTGAAVPAIGLGVTAFTVSGGATTVTRLTPAATLTPVTTRTSAPTPAVSASSTAPAGTTSPDCEQTSAKESEIECEEPNQWTAVTP